ncbi:MAG: hypothetical protein RID53_05425 [Coleofasciculus sp. B1-GNL1-01]|uniref:hypothetical protein n=1 Tax=Coleofasciculus sp. B1-GNL1-01 TaxID=3068484 RepID=UPI0032FF6A9B
MQLSYFSLGSENIPGIRIRLLYQLKFYHSGLFYWQDEGAGGAGEAGGAEGAGRLNFYCLLPIAYCLLPIACSLFPVPCSLFPVP